MTAHRMIGFRREVPRGERAAGRLRGVMLLEVLVSLALLAFGMAVVGLQIQTGLQMARTADLNTRAVMLIDTKFSELDAGVLVPQTIEGEIDGHFGLAYPGFAWRVDIEPTETRDLFMATVEIKYSEEVRQEQLRNPDVDVDFEDPRFRLLRSAHRLIPSPPDVNFERDMGMTQEQIQELSEHVPVPGIDLRNIDPRMLANLDDELLAELMPMLEEMLGQGGGLDALRNMSQEQRDALQDHLQGQAGNQRGRDRGTGERQRDRGDRQQGAAGRDQGGADDPRRNEEDQGRGRRQR